VTGDDRRKAPVTRRRDQITTGANVLAITPTAAEAIKGVVTSSGLPESSGGLRIARPPDTDERGAGFELSVTATPQGEDQVVEEHGAQVFLEPEAADVLDDRLLDADMRGDQVRFLLEPQ
jgi:iron-sulfur cluster assembly protein